VTPSLHFEIPGVPVAQPRARATTAGSGHARLYEAGKGHSIHDYKAALRLAASAKFTGEPLTEPLSLSVQFVFPRPKRLQRKRDPAWRLPKPDKPDADNLLKAVMDALNQVVWADDRQFFQVSNLSKWYTAVGEAPRTVVMVSPHPPGGGESR